jgi:hypothetical protein
MPVPVAARSKTQVFGRSPAEILGSNPTGEDRKSTRLNSSHVD